MQVKDIRPIKQELRERYKQQRKAMTEEDKKQKDRRICEAVRRLWQYRACRTLLCYVSTPIEVDTRKIIKQALLDGNVWRSRVASRGPG